MEELKTTMKNTIANVTNNATEWTIKAVNAIETIKTAITEQKFPVEHNRLCEMQKYFLTDSTTGEQLGIVPQVLDMTVNEAVQFLMEFYEDDGYGWSDFSDELVDLLYRLSDSCETNGGAQ